MRLSLKRLRMTKLGWQSPQIDLLGVGIASLRSAMGGA
jgi:hypothetical protein